MKVDYIVVGLGLAGVSFCEQLKAHKKSFVVFDNSSQQSSMVAGGLYNPVVLKRFTTVWKSKEQLDLALPLYAKIEKELGIQIDYKLPVYRKFASLEEQNDWFGASDKLNLSEFLSPKIIKNNNLAIEASYGFGEVLHTGRIEVKTLIEAYVSDLKNKGAFYSDSFQYEDIRSKEEKLYYKGIQASNIVFSEGYGITKNPYFNQLPLNPAKGELLVIHAPELQIDFVLKSAVFLIPMGEDLYIVGATYEWKDLSNQVSLKAKEDLLNKLKKIINCSFEVVDQVAGIRPTVKDRRPLVGRHQEQKNMYVLNGLGTRGVMIGPYVAKQLFDFIEKNIPLDKEINIDRFI
ncbi:FAD-binding oxidoreductase [Tamlana fucoidanivorans]|uniref:FAD-binding oxidoreductase n=1 Tax=Allotamlana fucoidanivorans TaxID=2583814 RepID=A0A5C4SIY2_9FLAO|nr:FAD-dependent oxidoreductase [Tamlana fucoidanivorans]TNJ43698.1 FAD-binding oxidoreductase [Tamlana fucoidanivorans]